MTKRLRVAGSSNFIWVWAGPGLTSRTTPTPSTWPVTRWPPRRSPSLTALSKFTRSPAFFKGKVVQARVSGDTSKSARGGSRATTVRQAPATATDSPRVSSETGNEVLTASLQALGHGSQGRRLPRRLPPAR